MVPAGALEELQHPAELSHAHPFDLIHEISERWTGLVLKSGHDSRFTPAARAALAIAIG
jgi:hypothetical protein